MYAVIDHNIHTIIVNWYIRTIIRNLSYQYFLLWNIVRSFYSLKIRIYFCAITKKSYIKLVYLNPWIFISNKNNNIKTFLLIFLLFCILYIFFHVVGHTTTVFCPQPFQKNSPNYRRDLCLRQISSLHSPLIKVTWEIL